MRYELPAGNPRSLVSYIRRHRGLFWIEAAGGIIYNTTIVAGPIVTGKAIDAAAALAVEVTAPGVRNLMLHCLLLVGITAFFQYARYVKRKYIRDMCFRIRSDMRAGLVGRTLTRRLPDLELESVGDLISRTIGDVEQVVSTVETTINEAWDTWLLMLSYLVVLLWYSPQITLISSVPIPLALYVAHAARHPLYNYSVGARRAAAKVTSHLRRTLNNVALLRLFGREAAEGQRLGDFAAEQMAWTIRTSLFQTGMMPIYAALASLGVIGALGLGGQEVLAGNWTVGTFTAYVTMFLAMSRRTSVAARVFNRWHAAKASWDRILEKLFLDQGGAGPQSSTLPVADAEAIRRSAGPPRVSADNLSFRYPAGTADVLRGISFTAPPGAVVGVTGGVGSGKTALASVLTGLYPYTGQLLVDGVELRNLSAAARRELVAYSGQESFLFSATIAANIAFGQTSPDPGRLERALYLSGLLEDLTLFASGIETIIGERGVRLSGGQRQRLALARALYHDSPLLILDDPFSAVDIATERRIIERLREELADRTTFIFSHRLNAFVYADQILVLDRGQVAELGSHAQLLASGGVYAKIYTAQTWMERDGHGGNGRAQ